MLQKIQGYDVTIEYRRRKMMTLADTLSKLPNPNDKDEIGLDLRVDGVETTAVEVRRCDLDLINFSQNNNNNKINSETRQLEIRPQMHSWKPSSKDGLAGSKNCQLTHECSGHSVMSRL